MSDAQRIHLVLVPGFAGFDALGNLDYYAGITPLFQRWQADRAPDLARCELHYFDNLPTAGVETRAARLQRFLAKRVARGTFAPGDTVALVGHSTGGLDIRRLVCDLATASDAPIAADGHAAATTPQELLGRIRHLVFLSVPQFGTNIADWVHAYEDERKTVVRGMQAGLSMAELDPIEWIEARAARLAGRGLDADLLVAVKDALDQTRPPPGAGSIARADADEAASQLALWLRHIVSDFSAIDDLRAAPAAGTADASAAPAPPPPGLSPAHFAAAHRAWERRTWRAMGADTLSFATLGWRPFQLTPGKPAPAWRLLQPSTGPFAGLVPGAQERTDLPYRFAYRACAGGPFAAPADAAADRATGARVGIEVWDNDGIVNTASMLWPDGAETRLVRGDHGDIIGHHRLAPADADARDHMSYDLLRSETGPAREFHDGVLESVWRDVFSFCAR